MNIIYNICLVLTIVGAINWLLIGLFNYDLVAALLAGGSKFGHINIYSKVVYTLVGAAGVFLILYIWL